MSATVPIPSRKPSGAWSCNYAAQGGFFRGYPVKNVKFTISSMLTGQSTTIWDISPTQIPIFILVRFLFAISDAWFWRVFVHSTVSMHAMLRQTYLVEPCTTGIFLSQMESWIHGPKKGPKNHQNDLFAAGKWVLDSIFYPCLSSAVWLNCIHKQVFVPNGAMIFRRAMMCWTYVRDCIITTRGRCGTSGFSRKIPDFGSKSMCVCVCGFVVL